MFFPSNAFRKLGTIIDAVAREPTCRNSLLLITIFQVLNVQYSIFNFRCSITNRKSKCATQPKLDRDTIAGNTIIIFDIKDLSKKQMNARSKFSASGGGQRV